MLEKASDRRRGFAAGPLPAQAGKQSEASTAAVAKAPKPSEQTLGRPPGWIESGAHSRLRCAPRPRSSARSARIVMKASGRTETERTEAGSVVALPTRVVTSSEANAANGRGGKSALKRRDDDFRQVLALVSRHFDVPTPFLLHRSRCRAPIARARQVAMYLLNTSLSRTMTEIGACFGRDRTTIAYACARIEDWRDDEAFDEEMAVLEAEIGALVAIPGQRK